MNPHDKLAFLFPGQGSQSIGMLATLAESRPEVGETFSEASRALGYDLWELVRTGPEDQLNQTEFTQPAMLAAGVAVWRVWVSRGGPVPAVMAGHSLGEYTALVCAESLGFRDAVRLVADRARFMQQAVPAGTGGMAAILGLDDAGVAGLCERAAEGEVLAPVNYNSPGQVVVAGTAAAVKRAVDQAAAAGAKRAVILPVSVPSHCALMHPAALRLGERLEGVEFNHPRIPVIHNFHVSTETSAAGIRAALVRQIESPVRWGETVLKMAADGVDLLIECGPGKVLSGLSKRIAKNLVTLPVYDPETLQQGLAATGVK
ncbi:MAG: ACP S-malonyltransferase [Gammaproteobacteria bacterium]|nr:ACP S-malonyltransferase [Gammaproteobacteria bacterium]